MRGDYMGAAEARETWKRILPLPDSGHSDPDVHIGRQFFNFIQLIPQI
jgi:hypothetical protein